MALATVSGAISNFINRVETKLPQFSVNSSTSRFVSVYSKAIAGLAFFELIDTAHYSYKIYSAEVSGRTELESVKARIFQTGCSVGILAAMYFNPYVGSSLFFGKALWFAFQTRNNLFSPRLILVLNWSCLFVKSVTGLMYLFNPTPVRLGSHVAAIALRRFLITETVLLELPSRFDIKNCWYWCNLVIVPLAADLACVKVGIRILSNK